MKNQFLYNASLIILIIGLITACSDDDDNSTPEVPPVVPIEDGFAISTVSGAWPDLTTYIQWKEDLEVDAIDLSEAIELTGSANTFSYDGAVFAAPFGAPANLVKYTIGSNSIPQEEQRIVVPGANTFSTIYFQSETVAYGTVAGGISKLIVFDPSTMRITDEVSLTSVTSKFPEATRTYYLEMVERDNKLFMGVHYEVNFSPLNDSAYVAIIDLATNQVEKVLSDGRTGMVFGGQAAKSGMVIDGNGDIYVQALGTTNAGGSAPSGVLRIKNGETDFDADYFFNMEAVVGNICYGLMQTSSGRAFTSNVQDENDFWEFATGEPQFKYVEIDLANKQSLGDVPGLPTTYGSRRMILREMEDQNLVFTTATNDENAAYILDASTNNADKLFTSSGGYITGLENLDD